ncbi:MAG: TonB-dependent receptor [Caulobacter sp.]|nr:TonB-dependent receptor [Caulobacter sp.]
MSRERLLISVSAVAVTLLGSSALAQSSTTKDAPIAQENAVLGEVIVTANKRSESIQKVPVSVTAYSGDQLQALGITDTTQITQQIPSLRLNAWSPNITIFNLRGISQNNFTDYLEAPIAVYVDDAYMGSINGLSGQLFDVQRLEVLRGPQGTLFGRNATGGLIQYFSTDASKSNFNGYATASYESYNRRTLEGAVGGPVSDHVRFRVAGRVVKADGYIKSQDALPGTFSGNGQDLGGENGWALRGTLQADLGERGKLDLWYKHSEDNHVATGGYVFDNCNLQANGYCTTDAAGLSNGSGGVINGITGAAASPFANFSNVAGYFDRKTDIYQANLKYDFDGATLTAITNYTDLTKSYQEDGDALPIDLIVFRTNAHFKQFSQELRLSGDLPRFRWQAGAYYLNMDIKGDMVTIGSPALGAAVAAGLPGNNPVVNEKDHLTSKNWSVFGQTEYDLTDQLTLVTGLRYSKDNKHVDYKSVVADGGVSAPLASNEAFDAIAPGVDTISKGDVAARVTLNYKPDESTLLFASWNRGIKGGNFTLNPNVVASNFRHRPETLNAYELGAKWSNAGRTLRLNATAYHYDYKDYQTFAMPGGTPQVGNSDATATGAELEAVIRPISGLNISLGATWETSKVDAVQAAGSQYLTVLVPGSPAPQYCGDQGNGNYFCDYPVKIIKDAQLPNAPKYSLNYLARYDFDAFGGNLAAQIDGVWYDKQYLELTNGRSSLQPAYNVTNASLIWTAPDDRYTLELFAHNIFDKAYRAYALNMGPLGTTATYAKPETYGASISVKW